MTDPNWFYSTLAQSAAAIVGVLGALLVLKITETSNAIRSIRVDLLEKKNRLKKNTYPIINAIEELEKRLRLILVEAGTKNDDSYVVLAHFNQGQMPANFGPILVTRGVTDVDVLKEGLILTSDCLKNWKNLIESFDKNANELSNTIKNLEQIKQNADLIAPNFGEKIETLLLKRNEVKEWNEDFLDFKDILEEYNKIIIPKSYYFILAFLAFIVVVGIIAPLFYLSAYPGYSKIILIFLFLLGSIGLIVYFIYNVYEIRSIR